MARPPFFLAPLKKPDPELLAKIAREEERDHGGTAILSPSTGREGTEGSVGTYDTVWPTEDELLEDIHTHGFTFAATDNAMERGLLSRELETANPQTAAPTVLTPTSPRSDAEEDLNLTSRGGGGGAPQTTELTAATPATTPRTDGAELDFTKVTGGKTGCSIL